MPFNGNGTFTPAVTFVDNTVATAEDQNTQDQDIAGGLSQCITSDGQSTVTANIPFSGFKLTQVANGSANSDAANVGQLNAVPGTTGNFTVNGNLIVGGTSSLTGTVGIGGNLDVDLAIASIGQIATSSNVVYGDVILGGGASLVNLYNVPGGIIVPFGVPIRASNTISASLSMGAAGGSFVSGFNIGSVLQESTGTYRIVFANALNSASYIVTCMSNSVASYQGFVFNVGLKTINAFTLYAYLAGTATDTIVNTDIAIIGGN